MYPNCIQGSDFCPKNFRCAPKARKIIRFSDRTCKLYLNETGFLQFQGHASSRSCEVEQIVGKTSDEKPCLNSCKLMAARFVPSKRVLPLFYPVFNLGTPIIDRDYSLCFKVRVGHNKSDTREEFAGVPFDFAHNPSELIPFLRLVVELEHLHLYLALWGTTDGALQVGQDTLFEAVVGGNPNEVGDSTVFTKFVEVRTGKCRIAREPKLFEPGPVALNQRRDKIQDAIGGVCISGSQSCAQKVPLAGEAKQRVIADLSK